MVSPGSEQRAGSPKPVKIVIAGGFGVGKTTFVGAVSEISPLRTEEEMTVASEGKDDLSGVERKRTTTVALDFGRITFDDATSDNDDDSIVLYLFGSPGQQRFVRLWPDLAKGAIGAVVLLDTRRLQDGFAAIDFFERRNIPFVVAVNCFDDSHYYEPDEVRQAAVISPNVPVLLTDARDRQSCKQALMTLVQHALNKVEAVA